MPTRVRIGSAVLLPGSRILRGPAGEVRVYPQTARLIARLAAGAPGITVPWRALVECLYVPGALPRASDGGAEVVHTVACHARRALRQVGAGTGIRTAVGHGARLDSAAADGAVVTGSRRDRTRLLDAHAHGLPGADLAARFGFKSRRVAYVAVCKAKRQVREAGTTAAGGGA